MTWLCSHKAGWSALLPGLLFAAGPVDAAGVDAPRPSLSMPVDCDMAALCSIQKYYDRAPGPERLDYRCGSITTDGHDGLDIRLRAMPDIARNIPVIAAADGVVLRVRDGMADANVRATGSGAIGDRLAGNAVVIDHGHGWVTQYSHLKNGSVAVAPGRTVKAGQRIGAIGMSGNAEFAHLHFEVRHDGQAVDPFAPGTATGCAAARQARHPCGARRRCGNWRIGAPTCWPRASRSTRRMPSPCAIGWIARRGTPIRQAFSCGGRQPVRAMATNSNSRSPVPQGR